MMSPESAPSGHEDTQAGYVTLVGRPNAGKSTLMNALVGEPLSIVTPKAQTTWQRVTGILTTGRSQMIFLDTPGLLDPRDLLQKSMLSAAQEALQEADVILLVLDGVRDRGEKEREQIRRSLADRPPAPLLAAVNKIDLVGSDAQQLTNWVSQTMGAETFQVCALDSSGVEDIKDRLEELLPPGPFLYPPDDIARDPVRFFVAEMIRETVFQEYHEEIPYSVFCRIEEFREQDDPLYIQAHLFVERKSQKGILIGKGGASIRNLGSLSRLKIEEFLGRRVYLDLWVKVLPGWRRRRADLRRFGFQLPDEEGKG